MLTNQQYYGGLNRRFDRRVRLLSRVGFTYDPDNHRWFLCNRKRSLGGCQIMHMDRRAFDDELARHANRPVIVL